MSAPSTRQKLLSLIEDVEIVTKELLDHMSMPKQQKPEGIDSSQLVDLVIQKDKEIQETLSIAKEQAELQKKQDELKTEVDKRDTDIRQLQKNLKEAETLLSTAVYQARQKLKSINQASSNSTASEELIKYAHRISASNAVAAPPAWAPGDHRRPYPTDIDMRCGLLGRLSDMPISNQTAASHGQSLAEVLGAGGTTPTRPSMDHMSTAPSSSQPLQQQPPGSAPAPSMQWQSSMGDMSSGGATHHHTTNMDAKSRKDHEEIELMSSDSSSSSSSDE